MIWGVPLFLETPKLLENITESKLGPKKVGIVVWDCVFFLGGGLKKNLAPSYVIFLDVIMIH